MKRQLIIMAACWSAQILVYPQESHDLGLKVYEVLGPTGFCLLPLAVYLVIYLAKIKQNWCYYGDKKRQGIGIHVERQGDIAGMLGLMGTILGMIISTKTSGEPDIGQFMVGLISTAVGVGICIIMSEIISMIERPDLDHDLSLTLQEKNDDTA